MLELRNIVKTYETGDNIVSALDDVSICFRENEFVSILGASGCGKTTLLNIVGGLDRYTSGDLIINGKSTKQFRDRDWDTYRNHSIGFVFQSYNLIPHQTVLANVELALTLSGVSKHERRKRAIEALTKVGLGDQLNKKPNQMSGGQMQRVAIARALVNNPDILLADEPTGALDTHTSVQIMELLKEVAEDRLVIMVTHNPDLAEEYSTRIVRLSDGQVIGDTNPITADEYVALQEKDAAAIIEAKKDKKAAKAAKKKSSMSFATAISLSFKNLLTKKGRTIMTSFAGSIGIIGIALILSLSNGIQIFIDQVQEDTLSTYPLTIQNETSDLSAMMSAMTQVEEGNQVNKDPNKIYVDDSMDKMVDAMLSTTKNDLVTFKKYLDENYSKLEQYVSDIQYTYDMNLQVYSVIPDKDEDGKDYNRVTKLGLSQMLDSMGNGFEGLGSLANSSGMMDVMTEMIDNQELINQQYEKIAGEWPKEANEVVLVVSKDNKLSKMTLYMLGILDQGELDEVMAELLNNKNVTTKDQNIEPFDFDDFLNMEFYLVNTSNFFEKTDKTYVGADGVNYNIWNDSRENPTYDEETFITANGTKLKISGIIRPRVDATATSISSPLAYTRKLTDKILADNANSEVIDQQKNKTPTINVTTGLPFERTVYTPENIHELIEKIDDSKMQQFYAYMTTMIKSKEEFSSLLEVKDAEGLKNVFMLLPMENKIQLVSSMLTSAKANPANTMGLNILCSGINMMFDKSVAGAYNVNVDTIPTLMPVMSMEQIYILVNGIAKSERVPMDIPGLLSFVDENTLSSICTEVSVALKEMTVTEESLMLIMGWLDDDQFKQLESALYSFAPQTDATKESVLEALGDAQKASPASINFYAKDFNSKAEVEAFIKDYNKKVEAGTILNADGEKTTPIEYTDIIGVMMSSVSIIIDVISYVLIAFVSISLVVSSIMIGIITNISVLERTKEIGILRAIGASKKDISRVFNAETLIIGLAAGVIGIITTILLCIPANAIIQALTGFKNINAVLPPVGGAVLVAISMLLTIIAGLIPAKKASKKDPVIALRTE